MNPAQMGNQQMAGMVQPMGPGPGINPNSQMMSSQPGQMAQQGPIAQNPQPGISGIMGQTGGGAMMPQTGRITPASMGQQGSGMIGQTGGNMIPQANRTMAPTTTMMSQQGAGMVGPQQGMSSAGVPGIQQQQQQQGGQQSMFPGTQQFSGGMAQNFGGGYGGNQGMPQQPNIQQNMQMGNFNQINAQQRSQAEFLAQQQRNIQQHQANQQQVQANRGQFTQQVPNVTMNQGMNQGMSTMGQGAPPYPRQQQSTPQQQQLYQQQQTQRMRQQQLLMQQQQQLGK